MKEDKHMKSTVGIDIETWTYPESSKEKEPVTFLAWDFAGQVCTYSLRQYICLCGSCVLYCYGSQCFLTEDLIHRFLQP